MNNTDLLLDKTKMLQKYFCMIDRKRFERKIAM